ncbi:MAG: ABC transporter ATP-binding protein [Burkholderiales bacterium]
MADAPVLRLEGVRKSYGVGTPAETEVLHGVDLVLEAGEFAALIGPSGSGKSTLLNLVGLLDRPSAGRVWIGGRDATALDDAALTRLRGHEIGFVFQYHHLLPEFTAVENVMLPSLASGARATASLRADAMRLVDAMGLGAVADHRTNDLSGGQQQRAAIARALAMRPRLVLADEPTGNLDTASADTVFGLLREINARDATAFLIVTHDPRLAGRCDRIVELVDGRIVADRRSLTPVKPVEAPGD